MTPIQIILLGSGGLLALLYFIRFRTRLLDRVLFLGLVVGGALLVIRPDWATGLANLFGVGRGADLVTYLGFVIIAYLWLMLYTRLRKLDTQLTELTRQIAILEAKKPDQAK
ncbi:MAG: DUF2304 domain-containing protein [Chloroflexi bacterium]|nr:MAG: DUF2304 domain-containing protein [Chloroflexota bacterium]MBL1193302.1 DUF2304 domain-containing protein [Chloroflexota bacterium]NOH10594.1 DUF2304 domain-containing protein [Chloroflexota bacterium]